MKNDQDVLAIERKLAHCRQLTKEFPDGPTAKHIRELEEELKADLAAELGTLTRRQGS
jgi:hypothetical protein